MLGRFGKDAGSFSGMEIGPDSVRALRLRRQAGRYQVLAWGIEPFPPTALDEGRVRDLQPLVAALRRLAQRLGGPRHMALALPANQVIVKRHHLPAGLGEERMEAQLLAEADRFVPFALDELALDFHVQRPCPRDPAMLDVLVAACRQVQLDTLQDLLQAADLRASVLEVDTLVLRRLLPASAGPHARLLRIDGARAALHAWPEDEAPWCRVMRTDSQGTWIDELARWLGDPPSTYRAQGLYVLGAHATLGRSLSERLAMRCHFIESLPVHTADIPRDSDDLRRHASLMSLACCLAMRGLEP